MAERKGPFDRLRRSPLSLVVLLQRAIADLVNLIMVFYKKGCCLSSAWFVRGITKGAH